MTPLEQYEAWEQKRKNEEKADWLSLTDELRKADEDLLSKAYDLNYVWLGKIHDLEEQAVSKRIKRLIHEHAVHEYHLEEASCGLL